MRDSWSANEWIGRLRECEVDGMRHGWSLRWMEREIGECDISEI